MSNDQQETEDFSVKVNRLTDAYLAGLRNGNSQKIMVELDETLNASPDHPKTLETREFLERLDMTF